MIQDVPCNFLGAVSLISWTIVDDDGESLEVSSVYVQALNCTIFE